MSSLELKLASAKKELASVLGGDVCFPAVPPLPRAGSPSQTASSTSEPLTVSMPQSR